ncbi:MAG: lantibiotic dehydratase [Kofleriaceae bacterium]
MLPEGLRPAGWFLLRTPLLPVETLAAWAADLAVPATDASALGPAVTRDRETLRARLRDLIALPEIQEALASASASLLQGLPAWRTDPESEAGQKVERALVRYLTRMASRPTPFQLLAGISMGELGAQTAIRIAPRAAYRRRTRVEAAHVQRLAQVHVSDTTKYRPSTGLYVLHHEIRCFRRDERAGMRTWEPMQVTRRPAIDAVVGRARGGATLAELAAVARAVEPDADVVNQLVAMGALVHDLEPPVTGEEPLAWLVERLGGTPGELGLLAQRVAALDDVELGGQTTPPAGVPLQIDLVKPVEVATLDASIATDLARALDVLARLTPRAVDPLARMREAYARRYDDLETPRFVPLLELVDPDGGVGLDGPQGPHRGWLPELELPAAPAAPQAWGARETFLLGLLATRATAIELDPAQLDLAAPAAIPDSLAVIASLVDQRIVLHHARANATRLVARFAHVGDVRARLAELVAAEAALHPDATLAEIVHAPIGGPALMGALHQRPVLRELEIPLLARSGADADHQVPPDDLVISVGLSRTIVWSNRLNRRILPRLASAHRVEFRKGHVPAFRLLSAISQEAAGPPYLDWSWAPLVAPYFPRVTLGRVVLALAEWHLGHVDVAALDAPTPAGRLVAVRALRERLSIPRVVAMLDVDKPAFDNVLHVDLEHSLAVDSFVQAVVADGRAVLREVLEGESPVRGPEGSFANEVVIPFIRHAPVDDRVTPPHPRSGRHAFAPGSEWLALRIDAGMGRFDRILVEHLLPVVRRARASGAADRWFFLRLGLPTPQLRLRLHGDPVRLASVRAELEGVVAELVARNEVFRAEWTTYEREVERYGGAEGVVIAEHIFEADSDAVAAVIETLVDPTDELVRWRLALVGVDRLLSDLGLDSATKLATLDVTCARWRSEFAVNAALDIRLGSVFRRERSQLEAMLAGELGAVAGIYMERSARIRPHADALRSTRLTLALDTMAASFGHMHCIRQAIRHSRVHELVVYDFLRRIYRSQIARRARNGATSP